MARHEQLKGEESIIQGFLAPLAEGWPRAFGLIDDCAAIAPAPGQELIVKTDPIRAGVHFFEDDDAGDAVEPGQGWTIEVRQDRQ